MIGIHKANSVDPRRPVFQSQSMDPSKIHLRNNNVVSFDPELIPNWGSRQEQENPEIPRGLTQDERNTDHLVELFTAWTLLNKAHIRKTVVITSVKNKALLERWEEWGHVALYSQNTVIDSLRIKENDILAKIWGKYKQLGESGSSLPATTPNTPVVDPRTPRAPWDSRNADGPSSPKEMARHNYPAPYR
jgi:chromo domain-containing protein 1